MSELGRARGGREHGGKAVVESFVEKLDKRFGRTVRQVLQAMGLPGELLGSAMRFTLSSLLSDAEVEEAARRISICVNELRLETSRGSSSVSGPVSFYANP